MDSSLAVERDRVWKTKETMIAALSRGVASSRGAEHQASGASSEAQAESDDSRAGQDAEVKIILLHALTGERIAPSFSVSTGSTIGRLRNQSLLAYRSIVWDTTRIQILRAKFAIGTEVFDNDYTKFMNTAEARRCASSRNKRGGVGRGAELEVLVIWR